jgi:glycyl-tRNA synthetase beta chain
MAELLLELLSEEIPARMQARAAADLAALVGADLAAAGLAPSATHAFATPRRLVLHLEGLPTRQPDQTVERRGPRVGAPQAAMDGFLKSLPATTEYRLEERAEKKGAVLHAVWEQPGRPTAEIVAEVVPAVLARFPWPKSMRWGAGEARWVRPLQSILCLLDGAAVRFAFGGCASGDTSRGHRFMAAEPFVVSDFAGYVHGLRARKVLLDAAERRRLILERARALAENAGLRLRDDPALVDEVAGLIEWPVPLLGRIDAAFMDIPGEVLVSTMRANQKYLALETADGKLADRFVVVANIEAPDGGAAIVAGNERVLRARFWDARHFWEQDKKQPLEAWLPKLDRMVFHADLGTQGERVQRLVALTGELARFVPGADRLLAERAALLAKADLVTGMVGEFPELQGVMGGHYARARNEPEAVATAIAEHYQPKGPDDRCPTAPASIAVALADRLDALAGFFAKGIRPTGSKDPFALRRAALGIIRLIIENRLRLPLLQLFGVAVAGYGERLGGVEPVAVGADLLRFFADRLKVHLRDQGVRHDLASAVFAAGEDDDLVRLLARIQALRGFLDSEDGRNLLVGYRRASNIVAIEEKRDGRPFTGEPTADLLRDPAEIRLHRALLDAEQTIAPTLEAEDFAGAMAALAALRQPVDAFFDGVLVNAPEPELRLNRLLMLGRIRSALGTVADFSLIEDAPAAG